MPELIYPAGLVCGIDEAGAPLAGPVVAAAVILNGARPIAGLDDSRNFRKSGGSPGRDDQGRGHCLGRGLGDGGRDR